MFQIQRLKAVFLAMAVIVVLIGATLLAQQNAAPTPAVLQNYKPVTAERLKKPDDGDWLMVRRTYDGWGYSPLEQITTENVERLQPVWAFSTGVVKRSRSAADRQQRRDVRRDAEQSGDRHRREDRQAALALSQAALRKVPLIPHDTSRGVALFGDKVFFAAGEAVLVALDAKTGKEVWTTKVEDNKNGYYMSLAPLVADGKVMVGASGGEFGIRGFVAAFDPDTGKELWRALHRARARRARQRDVAERAISGRPAAAPSG